MNQTERWVSPDVVLCDLDGVVWLAHRRIEGADIAIAKLREAGARVVFVTNNSHSTVAETEQLLGDIGIPASGDVITSSQAAARALNRGESVLVCGGPGIVESVQACGCTCAVAHQLDDRERASVIEGSRRFDAVLVGFHREFDYEVLTMASSAIRMGARFIATNDDATYPTPGGLIPGGGSIVAAVAKASGSEPVIAGKPHRLLAELVEAELGPISKGRVVMVGDRVSTDGAFARRLGCRFALVMTGVSSHADRDSADLWAESLLDVARALLLPGRAGHS